MSQIIPTTEQFAIATVGSTEPGTKILVNAFSGTGKTSTMELLGKAHPNKRILYLVFTRANKEEAKAKMPSNMVVENFHSMALRFMPEYTGRIQESNVAFKQLTANLSSVGVRAEPRAIALGMRLFQAWCQSDQTEITKGLLANTSPPPSLEAAARGASGWNQDPKVMRTRYQQKLESLVAQHADNAVMVARGLETYYSKPDSKVPHDFYLKKFQLDQIQLPFHFIILDEAQDTNDVCKAIVLQQKTIPIIVGDSHQSIYNWRGAVDALKQLGDGDNTRSFYLTQTFRFGDTLARVATSFLKRYKGETMELRGCPGKTTKIAFFKKSLETQAIEASASNEKNTYLFRTNRKALDFASEMAASGISIGFLNGIDNYGFREIEDIHHLSKGQTTRIQTYSIRQYKSIRELEEHISATGDNELKRYLELATTKMDAMMTLKKKSLDEKKCQILITTAHRAKGLEWDNVTLGMDFPHLEEPAELKHLLLVNKEEGATLGECIRACVGAKPEPELDELENTRLANKRQSLIEEANLLYVAATRAIKSLTLPPYMKKVFLLPAVKPPQNS